MREFLSAPMPRRSINVETGSDHGWPHNSHSIDPNQAENQLRPKMTALF